MQMANAFGCRSERLSILAVGLLRNRLLLYAAAAEALTLAIFLYVPPIARALGGAPPPALGWLLVLTTPFLLTALEETRKSRVRRTGAGR